MNLLATDFVEPANLIDAARMEVALDDVRKVSAAGWKLARFRGFRGYNFYGQRGDVKIRGEKNHSEVLALQQLLRALIAHDEEQKTLS